MISDVTGASSTESRSLPCKAKPMNHSDVDHRCETVLPFVAAVRVDGQNEVFGFKTPRDRDAFISDIKDRKDIEWAQGHHPKAAVAFIRNLLDQGDARVFVDVLPTDPDGLLGDLLRESVLGVRSEHTVKWDLALETLRQATRIAEPSGLSSLIGDILDS